jgi:hypothetical protein
LKTKLKFKSGKGVVEIAEAPIPLFPALSSFAHTLFPRVELYSVLPSFCQPSVIALLPAPGKRKNQLKMNYY